MSTKYQTRGEVPTETIVARLKELSKAVTKGKDIRDDEFTMRIPAECDRDADLVIAEAADRLAAADKTNMKILSLIEQYAGIDGGHHKQWLLDQILREITAEKYSEWVSSWKSGEDGPETYLWDCGIAP